MTDRIEGPFVTNISSEHLARNFVGSLILCKGDLLKLEQAALLLIQELRNEAHIAEIEAVLKRPPRWRHKVRGVTVQELCRAKVQAVGNIIEDDTVVVYGHVGQSPAGEEYWAREVKEFEDGRFERL